MSRHELTEKHLEIFLVAMTSKGLAEAALKLSISVPAVSKTLSLLGKQAGTPLFTLVKGRLQPTAAAERLFPFAQRAINQFDLARHVAQGLGHPNDKKLTIAAATPLASGLVARALQPLRAECEDLQITVRGESTASLLALVAQQEVDIGVTTPPTRHIDAEIVRRCEVQDLAESTLVAVLPAHHPLAKRTVVRPADLSTEPLVMLVEESATTALAQATFHQEGVMMNVTAIGGNSLIVCGLVQNGFGIGLLNPLTLMSDAFPTLVTLPFRPRINLRTCVYLPKARPLSAVTKQLIDHLRALAARWV